MSRPATVLAAAALACLMAVPAGAQGTQLAFGGLRADVNAPVQVTSDQLSVDQTTGTAVFEGNVVVVQGDMRLAASAVRVEYSADGSGRIDRLHATGGVTLAAGPDAAEAAEAVYAVAAGEVVLSGSVLLTQGPTTIAGQKLTVDLASGKGRMEGGVTTVLNPGGN